MNIPVDKNRRWIKSLHQGIDQLNEDLKAAVMKPAGMSCASDLLSFCEDQLGKKIDTIEDLVTGWNLLRDSRGLHGNWKLENGAVHGVFYECGCRLVRSGMIELHPVQCYCSQALMETAFSMVAKTAVEVDIKQSIGKGDDVCEFLVRL